VFAALCAEDVTDLSRLRKRVFVGIFVGYAGYYLVRNNLALRSGHPQEHRSTASGSAPLTGSPSVRPVEVPHGSVSDKSNPKYFLLSACPFERIMAAFARRGLTRRCSRSPQFRR